jgi:hypothetical protein
MTDTTVLSPRSPEERTLALGHVTIFWLRKLPDEEVLHGCVNLLGRLHHVHCIRVTEDPETREQAAVHDPEGRLDDAYVSDPDGGPFTPVAVPGFEGEYVTVILPGK